MLISLNVDFTELYSTHHTKKQNHRQTKKEIKKLPKKRPSTCLACAKYGGFCANYELCHSGRVANGATVCTDHLTPHHYTLHPSPQHSPFPSHIQPNPNIAFKVIEPPQHFHKTSLELLDKKWFLTVLTQL